MAERIVLEGLDARPTLFKSPRFVVGELEFYFENGWSVSDLAGVRRVGNGDELFIDGRAVFVRLADPQNDFICCGFYDGDRYYPGYFDSSDTFQKGAAWVDEEGEFQTVTGYYDGNRTWIPESSHRGDSPDIAVEIASRLESGTIADVSVFWKNTLFDQKSISTGSRFTIGTNRCDLHIDEFREVELVTNDGGVIFVDTTVVENVRQTDAQGEMYFPESWDGRVSPEFGVLFDIGEFTVVVRCSAERSGVGAGAVFDKQPAPYVGGSGIAHVVFLLLAMTMPSAATSLDLDGYMADNRFVQIELTPEQKEEEIAPDYGESSEEQSEKHAGQEGRSGKPDSAPTDGKLTIQGDKNDPFEIQKRDQRIASNAGIAKLASLYATADRTNGMDAATHLGAIDGHTPGANQGPFGFGIEGDMPGGGGRELAQGIGINDVGTNSLSKIQQGCKTCADANVGDKKEVPAVSFPPPKVVMGGGLDRQIIRRVISKSRRSIKFCYEQELQKNKNLSGEITVKFTISAAGNVVVASVQKGGTLKSAKVSNCVSNVVRRLVFPAPKDGMAVVVRYPFRFFKG